MISKAVQPIVAKNFAFGGCGWMLSYHLGVMVELKKIGVLDFDQGSKIATASGGAVVGSCFASGLTMDEMQSVIVKINEEARQKGLRHWWMNLDTVIRGALTPILPSDSHDRVQGKIVIPTRILSPLSERGTAFHTNFTSKTDLIDAVVASSYIPFFTGSNPKGFHFRGAYHTDGASTTISPDPREFIEVAVSQYRCFKDAAPIKQVNNPFSTLLQMAFPQARVKHEAALERGTHSARLWADASRENVGTEYCKSG
eukprot:TRINITY_DN28031_c0_g1_i1.p1 TRINITY_DN28031_c0_g1~~TRINITY_DN28031_c0_g1_i1.p1  ORF type:complete len:271 (+),score=19.18 TRINITY_DN28031_c0_g1_i1:47-814(+)